MQDRKTPILFRNKKDCCACGACMNACPKEAISMQEDKHGYIYPVIAPQQCIGCNRCKKVCAYQNDTETNMPLKTWVAVSKDNSLLMKSASGGVFSALAERFLKNQDFVSGAVFEKDFTLRHIITNQIKALSGLRGSKYTHSSTGYVFREIKEKLLEGKNVLFCGTPCQVAGLKAYLGKDYTNLLTMDLICHGVPSNRMFTDYIHNLEKKKNVQVTRFTFRDKQMGWGINGSIVTDRSKKMKVFCTSSSYMYYFLHSLIYRKNCYSCKYACSHRPGDLTIGDYWGIQKEHPEYLGNDRINETKGVSAIISNTEKGTRFIQNNSDLFVLYESSFDKVARGNAQLNAPSKYHPQREELLAVYAEGGWESIDDMFCKEQGLKRYSGYVKSLIPSKLKRILKRYLK